MPSPPLSPIHLAVLAFGVTAALTGLIWCVQFAIYPVFRQVGPEAFPAFHAAYSRGISIVVIPLMLLEVLTTAALCLICFQRGFIALAVTIVALLGFIWLTTFVVQVPLHAKLSQSGCDPAVIKQLATSNWIRTGIWSAKAALHALLLIRLMP